MYVSINGSGYNKNIYIVKSYRKENGSTSSKIHLKLGKLFDLLPKFDNDMDKLLSWANFLAIILQRLY